MHLRLAVLLPVRNAAATLAAALESLWNQTFRDFRVIAVDDGSTDGTPEILARTARSWRDAARRSSGAGPAFDTVRIEPGGSIARALIAGAAVAGETEYLGRHDGDDISHPERFERQIAWLDRRPDVGLLASWIRTIGETPQTDGWRRYEAWLAASNTPEEIARDLWVESSLPHPTVVMRREAYERAGGYRDMSWPEDYDLWLRMLRAGIRMAKLPEALVEWRDSPGRASRTQPEYTAERFLACRIHHLAAHLAGHFAGRPVIVWGAGRDGRRAGRALIAEGVDVHAFLDIDPRKIGRRAYGRPILAAEAWLAGLESARREVVLAAVGTAGARSLIRARLLAAGLEEGADFLCIA